MTNQMHDELLGMQIDYSDYEVQRRLIGLLPHRYPFLFVDKVIHLDPGKSIKCCKAVSVGEGYFVGHFPEYKVMPGVIMVEFMAQAAAICALSQSEDSHKREFFLSGLEEVKFRKVVRPGTLLQSNVELVRSKVSLFVFNGEVIDVESGALVVSATIKASLGKQIA